MKLVSLDAESSGLYPQLVLDYLAKKKSLESFINHWPDNAGYAKQLDIRKSHPVDRKHLVSVLRKQYRGLIPGLALETNLSLLEKENTYTVTTGQQIHIFLGPMYVYWKIISTLALAKKLKKDFPDKNFVPVFWMATEDHDFEEVNHFELFGTRFEWNSPDSKRGPVGRLSTQGLPEIANEIASLFANQPDYIPIHALFTEAYSGNYSFAEATRLILHRLFGADGLVILDPDDGELKRDFVPIMRAELLNQTAKKSVDNQSKALAEAYHLQVHPREINLFFSGSEGRSRLENNNGVIQTLNGETLGALNSIDDWLPNKVKDLSGNVILRPIYQECILPNIAYIAGPGELAYWMQFKAAFHAFQIPFPIVELRKSVFIIGQRIVDQLEKNFLNVTDLFLNETDYKLKVLNASSTGFVSLKPEIDQLNLLKDESIQKSAKLIPKSAKALAEAFKHTEQFLRKKDRELLEIQEDKQKGQLEKLLRIKGQVKTEGYTQERNAPFLSFILDMNSDDLVQIITENYTESASNLLFLGKNH